MKRVWMAGGLVFLLGLLVFAGVPSANAQTIRHVSVSDPTCGGQSPCYTTIQAAITAAQASDTVRIQPGTYIEQLSISSKNSGATSETQRIVIEVAPSAPVGSVLLAPPTTQCTNGHAVRLQQSKFITLRGLTISGAGGQAVSLLGGINENQAIHLDRLRVFGNGSSSCNGGITINRGNPDTVIANSLIYANGRNGIAFIDADGGPHYLVGNTIHGNAWNGLDVAREHVVWLVNNSVTGNGTATGSTGGRFGVSREGSSNPQPVGIHLRSNLVCGNRLGELSGPTLDATDAGNRTPTGAEGSGVTASPGCDLPSNVYANLFGPDGNVNTSDDDFTPVTASPLLDAGVDPRTLGFSPTLNPILESDYLGPSARPRLGTPGGTIAFDIGAREPDVADEIGPLVTIIAPPEGSHVRGAVPIEARATDQGSGVAAFTLRIGTQSLTVTLAPSLPPPAATVTATATWNTTAFTDGVYTLTGDAADASGNDGMATRVLVADNTPPETEITGGPSGQILVGSATFTFSGSDGQTAGPSLVFSWRIDNGIWSPFSADTTASFTSLAQGAHTFEVKARDLAGNEDPTPALRNFSVQLGPVITSITPSAGPIGTYVTVAGGNFVAGSTTVTFSNGLAAVIRTITPTQITTTVPIGATNGLVTVTTGLGSATAQFTVEPTGNFTLTAVPASPTTIRTIAGDQGAARLNVGGTGSFTSLVSLSVSTPPSGITTSFSPQLVAPGSGSSLTLAVANSVSPGTYTFTVTGQAQIDGRNETRAAQVSLEVLGPDTQAVTGRVLTAEAVPRPIPGVTVALGTAFTLTDAAGNFVLLSTPSGPNMLIVDGRTASTPQAQYPLVEVQINVAVSGPSRVPFNLYLPVLDTAHPINLPLDGNGFTTAAVQATTPLIPGLVIHVPQGTRIIGPDGNPVAQITITPVPVDRSPMPFPAGHNPPLLFAIQPGGAVPSQPLPISFPNVTEAAPGTSATMWFFDLTAGNWATWGTGTVSADGTQIVSDPGYGLPRFAWHYWDIIRAGLKKLWKLLFGGDPVDLATGAFTIDKTDLVLPGRIPISIQRSYRSDDTRPGFFGIGWNLGIYDSRITSTGATLNLITADQNTFQLTPNGPGQWVNTSAPFLRGAVVSQLPGEFNFQIRFKDGTVHRFERIVGFANTAGLAAITDRNTNTVTITRESPGPSQNRFGLITRITEPAGRSFTLAYDTAGRIETVTDPINRVVRYTYDGQGRLETVTDPNNGVTRYTYDAQHRILTITDPRQIIFLTNEYDAQGRVFRQIQADTGVWQFAYKAVGDTTTETRVTDPRGNTTTHRFTSQGFPLSTTDALGQTTAFEYAPGSNLVTAVVDPLGRMTRYTYDLRGNVESVTDPTQNTRSFLYETTFNRVTRITTPLVAPTQFAYDAQGNLTTITDPRGKVTTLTYNVAGQPETVRDPLGNTSRFTYDIHGNLATTADPLGNTASFQYDLASRLIRQIDPRGRATAFAYDPLNQIRTITDALGGLTDFAYDGNGNLRTVTDARLNPPTTYTYDVMNRLATLTDPLGASASFVYDLAGNLTRRTDRKGQLSEFAYDALNRRTTSSYADGSGTTLTYDGAGRLVRVNDSVGGTLTNTHDLLDRLLTQSTTLGTLSYAYDALGRRTQLNIPGVTPTTYDYDGNSRLTRIVLGTQAVGLDYDDAGRRTLLTLPNSVSTEYQYDAASQLTALIYRNAAGVLGNLSYQYDPAGNRFRVGGTLARTLLPSAVFSASYDAANRQRAFGSSQMTFDANGNLTTLTDGAQATNLAWDARDRLIGLEQPGALLSFAYAFGRRIAKTVNGDRTDYLYDGFDIAQQLDPRGTTTYLRSMNSDEVLGTARGTGDFFLIADPQGSTVAVTDGMGAVVNSYSYQPFGSTSSTDAAFVNPFQFTGRENDATADLYYYRARYYNPRLGRFISEDPIGFPGGDLNLYAYVRNSPLRFVDRSGLKVDLSGIGRLREPLETMKRTRRGRELYEELDGQWTTYKIREYRPGDECRACYVPWTREIIVDPDFRPIFDTPQGYSTFSLPRILGHELGHAATGAKDPPRGSTEPGLNVLLNENPIAQELGEPLRIRYHSNYPRQQQR